MTNGLNSTVVLRPVGRDAITFNLTGATEAITDYAFVVDLGRMDLNEEARWQWAYEQTASGGRATGTTVALVPLRLEIIIKATSVDYRSTAYRELQQAVMNRRGGTLEYLPEGAGAGVPATFYHYVASAPPRLTDDARNRWDAEAKSGGLFTLEVTVELQTQPWATSDPDHPVAVATATIDNWEDGDAGQTNRLTIAPEKVLGSLAALTRMQIVPVSGQRLGRVLIFRRTAEDSTLDNFSTVYAGAEASVIAPATAWSEITDGTRGGGSYMRCLPNSDANGVAQGLRFTVTHPADGQGRWAVFGVVSAGAADMWTHHVELRSGNIAQIGESYTTDSVEQWSLLYMGEFELPLTELSALTTGYSTGPYLDWYSTRTSGESELRLNGMMLVYVSDALGFEGEGTAVDVSCADGDVGDLLGGIGAPERLLLENLVGMGGRIVERAYVTSATYALRRVLRSAPRGDFLTLVAGQEHVITLMQERAGGIVFTDDFSGYTSYYRVLDTMDTVAVWTNLAVNTATYAEGSGSAEIVATSDVGTAATRYVTLDLDDDGRFADDDFFVFYLYAENITAFMQLNVVFYTNGAAFYVYEIKSLASGRNFFAIKRTEFDSFGAPAWSAITRVTFAAFAIPGGDPTVVQLDYLRFEKADPADADYPNPTGGAWQFTKTLGTRWALTEDVTEDDPGATLACLWTGLDVAVLNYDVVPDLRFSARVYSKHVAGKVGVFWRSDQDVTLRRGGHGYHAHLNVATETLGIYRYASGGSTTLYTTGFPAVPDRWYTLGIMAHGSAHAVYCALSSGLGYDDSTVFEDAHRMHAFTDTTYLTGRIGFLSYETWGRFDTVVIEDIGDKHVPDDQVAVTIEAVFRTISPFDTAVV